MSVTADDPRLASARALVTRITALIHELDQALNDSIPAAPTPDTPQSQERPGPDNTGVPKGAKLAPMSGGLIAAEGAVVEDRDITGSVTIGANNVTIRRCRITAKADAGTSAYPVKIAAGVTGTVIEDCEIDGNGRTSLCVGFKGYTLRRCNVHSAAGDLLRADGDVLVEDSWLHGFVRIPGGHHDGIQMLKGSNVTIRSNTIDMVNGDDPGNACFIISAQAPVSDVLIEGNWLNGGNYSLYLGANDKGIAVTNVSARDNTVSGWRYGPITAKGSATLGRNFDQAGAAI